MKEIIRNVQTQILSHDWSILKKVTFEFLRNDGVWETQTRQVYDRGNGAAVLLYHPVQQTVILTRQFRLPTYFNGNAEGMMIEVCAGILEEKEDPAECVRREAEEETGFRISNVTKVFESYMSPGSVTEVIHCFVAPYDQSMRVGDGGGLSSETENIEVMEMPLDEALSKVQGGEIKDGKTIMLLQHLKLGSYFT